MKKPIIEVNNLAVSFNGNPVLKDITCTANAGEITVILGTSGCGKTTLMKHLIGLYPIQQGKITILGERTDKMDEEAFARFRLQMGVLFQHGALLNSLNIEENVGIALERHTNLSKRMIHDIVRVKLNLVGLSHAISYFPEQLSGGMLKRAGLARAISMDPKILFCDEPSAGLDPVTLAELDKLFLILKEQLGISIVLVTHEVASIKRLADKIIFLEKGHVLFEGSLNEAVNSGIAAIETFFNKAAHV